MGDSRVVVSYILVDDDDRIYRFPKQQYCRFIRSDSRLRCSRFAGTRVRQVEVMLETAEHGRPLRVLEASFGYLYFASDGSLDRDRYEEDFSLRMGVAMDAATIVRKRGSTPEPNVIDARTRFDRRRVDHQCVWTPDSELETAIYEAALGTTDTPSVRVRESQPTARPGS